MTNKSGAISREIFGSAEECRSGRCVDVLCFQHDRTIGRNDVMILCRAHPAGDFPD